MAIWNKIKKVGQTIFKAGKGLLTKGLGGLADAFLPQIMSYLNKGINTIYNSKLYKVIHDADLAVMLFHPQGKTIMGKFVSPLARKIQTLVGKGRNIAKNIVGDQVLNNLTSKMGTRPIAPEQPERSEQDQKMEIESRKRMRTEVPGSEYANYGRIAGMPRKMIQSQQQAAIASAMPMDIETNEGEISNNAPKKKMLVLGRSYQN